MTRLLRQSELDVGGSGAHPGVSRAHVARQSCAGGCGGQQRAAQAVHGAAATEAAPDGTLRYRPLTYSRSIVGFWLNRVDSAARLVTRMLHQVRAKGGSGRPVSCTRAAVATHANMALRRLMTGADVAGVPGACPRAQIYRGSARLTLASSFPGSALTRNALAAATSRLAAPVRAGGVVGRAYATTENSAAAAPAAVDDGRVYYADWDPNCSNQGAQARVTVSACDSCIPAPKRPLCSWQRPALVCAVLAVWPAPPPPRMSQPLLPLPFSTSHIVVMTGNVGREIQTTQLPT